MIVGYEKRRLHKRRGILMVREFCATCNAIKKKPHICGDKQRDEWRKTQKAKQAKKK
jgi:hypothetical protein